MLKDNALFLDSSYNPFGVTISSLVFLHWEEYLFCRTKAQGILVQVELLLFLMSEFDFCLLLRFIPPSQEFHFCLILMLHMNSVKVNYLC